MKKKNIVIGALICFIISMVTIQYINYRKNIEVTSAIPSEKWSKEKSISKGDVKKNPGIITFEDEIYVVHTTENGIKLVKTNMLGDVIDTKNYEFGNFVADVTFTTDKENLYISWISINNAKRSFNIGFVDKELMINDIKVIEGITESIKVSDEELLVSSGENIKIVDNNLNTLFETEKGIFESVSAAKDKENTYIVYYSDSDSSFKTIILKDNKKIMEKEIVNVYRGFGLIFKNPVININDEELVMTYEEITKGEYRSTKGISYSLNNSKSQIGIVQIQGQPVRGIVRGDSAGTFFGYIERYVDKRFLEQDIVEFRIKDGEIVDYNYVSNSREIGFYSANYKEYVVFCEYIEKNSYEIKLSSSEEVFKESINFISKEEKNEAWSILLEGIVFSFAYIFMMGIIWILFALVIIGVISFISYNLSEKMRKITYIGALVIVGLFQLYMMKNMMYGKYAGLMPDYLSISVGLVITLIIYFISGIFSYLIFKCDLESIPLIPFGIVLVMETFLVLSVFVPYII
ncbi:hypothetical protein [Oceanirhabdus seepicola]|uniref:Uncharacterized protein n=1 Tax=Oceanirhabdus seepicola TaxID=2828781 RepID=A0A9J6NYD4_9CLOT|nr:hypothetical protein [Oceanirhabdus seepicola]MCM1988998.1 hypothetical protein [Oceanirhabdus seepicola]